MSSRPSCGPTPQPRLSSIRVSQASEQRLTNSVTELPEPSSPPTPGQTRLESLQSEWQLLSQAAATLVAEGGPMSPQTRIAIFEGELSRIQSLDFVLSIHSDGGPNGFQIYHSNLPADYEPDTSFMPGELPASPLSVNAWDSSEEIEYEDHVDECIFFL
ncbi:hypothetical protein Esti_004234 [Eimeria stiedai]